MSDPQAPQHVTTRGAVAIFRRHGLAVSAKTVSRWAREGKLPFVRTLGGHRRYDPAELETIVDGLRVEATP